MAEQFGFLLGAAFFSGFVDAMGGGGGLIQVPALFSALNHQIPATLLGTNKLASIWGTGTAAWSLHRRVRLEWNTAVPAALAAFLFAFCGAYAVTRFPSEEMRKLLPFVLFALLVYTWRSSQIGLAHMPAHKGKESGFLWLPSVLPLAFMMDFLGRGRVAF